MAKQNHNPLTLLTLELIKRSTDTPETTAINTWVRFAAGAIVDTDTDIGDAADMADQLTLKLVKRLRMEE